MHLAAKHNCKGMFSSTRRLFTLRHLHKIRDISLTILFLFSKKAGKIELLGKNSNTLLLIQLQEPPSALFSNHMQNSYTVHTIFRYIELDENLRLPPHPVFFLMGDVIIEIISKNSQHSPISSAVWVFFICWLHANYCTGEIISHSHLEFTTQ